MKLNFGIERERENKLVFKEVENDNGYVHFHSQIEICIVSEGSMDVLSGGKRRVLKKGEMSVALSYDTHAYKSVDYSKSTVIIIPLYMCPEFAQAIKNKKVVNPFICSSEAVKRINECYNEIKNTQNPIIIKGYVNVILGIVMENILLAAGEGHAENELLSQILFYIHENYKKDITLSKIAASFGYSQSYISRYFKNCLGIGIGQYITIIRLKNCIMLMQENKHSITYCAMESGFSSLRTFYRVFYKEFGITPKNYIKNKGL